MTTATKTKKQKTNTESNGIEMIRHITHKAILNKTKKELLALVEEYGITNVLKVAGETYRFTTRDGEHGTSTCFHGVFVAKDLLTGKLYRANTMFAPQALTEELVTLLNGADENPVKFSNVWQLVPSEKSGSGYAFQINDDLSPEVIDKNNALVDELISKF